MKHEPFDSQEVAFGLLAGVCQADLKKIHQAFDEVDNYTVYQKLKRNGGYRTISVPPDGLKEVQQKLLTWLYRLHKRRSYYANEKNRFLLCYKKVLAHELDARIHGSMPKKSIASACRYHSVTNANFVLEIDLKDAYPSVTTEVLYSTLHNLFLADCKAVFVTYEERRHAGRKFSKDEYLKYPLFANKHCFEFRKLIRGWIREGKTLEETPIAEIMHHFTSWLCTLVTHDGRTPQGVPTSGFLLNLVLSETKLLRTIAKSEDRNRKVSVYVDNFIITTMKKPDRHMIESINEMISLTGIFRNNPAKTKVYDLRNMSAPLLGMKLAKRKAGSDEMHWLDERTTRGLQRRKRLGGEWEITCLTLSKKRQKQYRAFLRRCVVGPVSDEQMARANGYIGHIVSVYGWPVLHMPATLRRVVQDFRTTFERSRVTYTAYRKREILAEEARLGSRREVESKVEELLFDFGLFDQIEIQTCDSFEKNHSQEEVEKASELEKKIFARYYELDFLLGRPRSRKEQDEMGIFFHMSQILSRQRGLYEPTYVWNKDEPPF